MIYFVVPEATAGRKRSRLGRLEKGLRRSALLASCATLGNLHRNGLGAARALGGAVAHRRRGPRPGGCGATSVRHGGRAQLRCHPARRRGRSAAPARCWTRDAPGACRGRLYRGSVRIDPALALAVIFPVGGRGGGRRGHRAQLRDPGRIFSERVGRAGQRGAESVPHRRGVRRAIRDRRRLAAMGASELDIIPKSPTRPPSLSILSSRSPHGSGS